MDCAALLAFTLACWLPGSASAQPLGLPALVERARANDHRVKEAQAQLRYYRGRYEEARWAWFPRVDSYLAIAGPTPEARNDGLGGPPTTRASLLYDLDFGSPGVMFRGGAEAILPLYTFGKLDALEQAAAQGVVAGEALARRARDEAELQVSQAYLGYCLAVAAGDVVQEAISRLKEAQKVLGRLRAQDSEQVTQMDVYKLEYYQRQADVQLAAAASGQALALASVRLLIAAAPDEVLALRVERFELPRGTLEPLDVYVARAISARPELKAMAAGIVAREQEVLIRERSFLPDFGLAGFFRFASTTNATRQLSPFAYDPYNELSAGLALVLRYQWDFPQKAALLEQSRAELEKLMHQRELLNAGVRLELEKAHGDTALALVKAEKMIASEKSARRWATAAFAAFDLGTGDTRELVDSLTALSYAAANRAQALHDVRVGLAALSRAVGEPVELVDR